MRGAVDVYVVKHGASYRFGQGEWTSSQRLADRFMSPLQAWKAIFDSPWFPHPERYRVVRLVSCCCRCRK